MGKETPTESMGLLQGTLDVLILRTLVMGPLHGYAVSRWIHERTEGVSPSCSWASRSSPAGSPPAAPRRSARRCCCGRSEEKWLAASHAPTGLVEERPAQGGTSWKDSTRYRTGWMGSEGVY
jgi:hypothetical protein